MIELSASSFFEALQGPGPVAFPVYEDGSFASPKALPAAERKALWDLAHAEGFKAGVGDCFTARLGPGTRVLLGLGRKKEADAEAWRRAAGSLSQCARSRWADLSLLLPGEVQAAAEGLLLGSYRFCEYKKAEGDKLAKVVLAVETPADRRAAEKSLAAAVLRAEAVNWARDLANRGPSDKAPAALAELARGLSGSGVSVESFGSEKARELGMGSFLGVARGSSVEPVFLHLTYKPKGAAAKKKVALVGKGVTFDSGGLSLKPPASMETMKLDMAGAAAVLAVFKVLPRLKPRAEVHGFCPLTYNMPGPDALKPGDVVKAMNGKTIEVLNTDAEGRLILADALAYAAGREFDAIVDLATLTGAVVTALGSRVTGIMGNNRALLGSLQAAAQRAQEPLCELPLPRDYKENIKSPVADLCNIGRPRGEAGSIIGGLFLEEFVGGKPWAHLDIAGTAWTDSGLPYCPKGGTGALVRTLIEYLERL